MSTALTVILIVVLVLLAIAVALYFVGRKMQGRQAEQQSAMEAAKQTVSMLIIDKKKMKIKDAGFPKIVEDSVPKYAKFMKYPVVKAKVGPKVMVLMCDDRAFNVIPEKKEVKVLMNGIYIVEAKSARGGLEAPPQKKKFRDKLRSKADQLSKETAASQTKKSKKASK